MGFYKRNIQWVLIGVTILLSGCATLTPHEAYRQGKFKVAAKKYKQMAQSGDDQAQFKLSGMYAEGQGVEKDLSQVVHWSQQAADQGNVRAMFNLGYAYENGLGIDRDVSLAEKWYRQAAERGFVAAQYNLGSMYSNNLIQPGDDVQGFMWLLVAQKRVESDDDLYEFVMKDPPGHLKNLRTRLTTNEIREAQLLASQWMKVR